MRCGPDGQRLKSAMIAVAAVALVAPVAAAKLGGASMQVSVTGWSLPTRGAQPVAGAVAPDGALWYAAEDGERGPWLSRSG